MSHASQKAPEDVDGVLELRTPPAARTTPRDDRVAAAPAPEYWVKRVQKGLPFRSLAAVMKKYEISRADICRIIGFSERSFLRRRAQKRLTEHESDRLYRLARIIAHANCLFQDPAETSIWLHSTNFNFPERSPLMFLHTEEGARKVDEALYRMEHGFCA